MFFFCNNIFLIFITKSMGLWQKKFLKQNCFVEKSVVVQKGAIIGVGCVICGKTIICGGAKILPYCVIENSFVGKNVCVGPFAHLRDGSQLLDCGKVGAFVETKKCTIGKNSKVPHLSYVGDCVMGENCNFGCGAICCNYDGKNKHKTKIGNNCFVGANVNLIAPIEIANDVFIAAGTTVNKSVENKKFVIGRVRQEVKDVK